MSTHVASIYTIFVEQQQKNAYTRKYSSTPTGLVWNTNMAVVSLCLNTNMAVVTTGENALNSLAFYYDTDAKNKRIAHCTDTIGNEAGVDHVLIQRTLHALLCKLCCCSRVVGLFIQKPLQPRAG